MNSKRVGGEPSRVRGCRMISSLWWASPVCRRLLAWRSGGPHLRREMSVCSSRGSEMALGLGSSAHDGSSREPLSWVRVRVHRGVDARSERTEAERRQNALVSFGEVRRQCNSLVERLRPGKFLVEREPWLLGLRCLRVQAAESPYAVPRALVSRCFVESTQFRS